MSLVVGDGPERDRLERETQARGLEHAVHFLGHRDDARAYLPGLDVFVNCSISEGISLTILEAMAAGVPVVATAVGGTPEIVTDEVGRLVPARDPSALAAALDALADAPAPSRDAWPRRACPRGRTLHNRDHDRPLPDDVSRRRLTCAGWPARSPSTVSLPPEMPRAVRAMTGRLAHRGPDGEGFIDRRQASFGHRRLAIIDVAGGAQPLANEDDTCWIMFNGEVYNHRTLRPELEAAGHRFRTSSDTETIVHAWEQYGPACVERLEGMFALAILDERRRELFIARDRLGKKPLYYAVLDGVLHFASELPALAASPSWKGDLDLSGLEGYLSLGYWLAPSTPFAGVFKLPPAHTLHVKDGRLTTRRYWDVTRVRLRPARRERPARRGGRRRSARPSRIASRARCRLARSCPAASTRA